MLVYKNLRYDCRASHQDGCVTVRWLFCSENLQYSVLCVGYLNYALLVAQHGFTIHIALGTHFYI